METVHIVFGPQGAGKSTYARALAADIAGVRFSIDEWMHELYAADSPTPLRLDWVMARVQRCERRIWAVASETALKGVDVVLDLGFMKAASRASFRALAMDAGLAMHSHFITAPVDIRRSRVMARNEERGATFSFEVTPAMFGVMESQFEAPSDDELGDCLVLQTG